MSLIALVEARWFFRMNKFTLKIPITQSLVSIKSIQIKSVGSEIVIEGEYTPIKKSSINIYDGPTSQKGSS